MSASAGASAQAIAARFSAANEKLTTLAVTGTNGKTTTVSMIDAIVRASGEVAARLTTLGAYVGDVRIEAENPSVEFLRTVETAVQQGVRTLALEVTSKALAGGLAKRWRPTIAVFTNLSRDHFEMHGSAEHYLASKAQLFMALDGDGIAVLNGDDSCAALIAELLPQSVEVRRFSRRSNAGSLAATKVESSRRGTHIILAPSRLADRLGGALELGIVGEVHAENALAAAIATDAAGYAPEAIRAGLSQFVGVPGRFEIVHSAPLIVVDYAHTPDGLTGTLATARKLVEPGGRLLCVFGCGGSRDRGKRPLMAAAVDEAADIVILTSDNPRHEDPQAIANDALTGRTEGRSQWLVELDRATAVRVAVEQSAASDVIVVAGKGHESTQEIGDRKIPMSDRDLVKSALAGD